LSPSFISKC